MTVYQVHDWDSMASNWGEDVVVATFSKREGADALAEIRNERARQWFVKTYGASRERETDLWKRAYVVPVGVQ